MLRVVGLLVVGGVVGFLVGWGIASFAPELNPATIQSGCAVVGAIIGGQAGYRLKLRSGNARSN
jgi:hypothetical protein